MANDIVTKIDPKTGIKMTGMYIDDKKTNSSTGLKRKFKLYKVIKPIAIVSGIAALITAPFIANAIGKNNYNAEKNANYKYSEKIEKEFEDAVLNDSVLSQLISQKEYQDYVKYRDMLELKRKIDAITLENTTTYELNYDDLTEEYINELININNEHYGYMDPEYYRSCNLLKSVSNTIEKYGKEYGNQLVENITARVLAAKVVDSNNLDPSKVDNIELKLNNKDKLKVDFDYIDGYTTEKYKSDIFKNQNSDFAAKIGKNLNDNQILESIYNTEVLATDDNYEIGAKIK